MQNRENRNLFLLSGICLAVFLTLPLNTACSGNKDIQYTKASPEGSWRIDAGQVWSALALLQTGENPLWFELGEKGPVLIESPSGAALAPYAPWPHARFIAGMQFWNGFLVMAVNRDGFIVIGRGGNSKEAVLYRVAGAQLWDPYTTESFFIWEERPAVLLYRNDFFIDPVAPPLERQVYVLDLNAHFPVGVSVPALESFPKDSPESVAPEWEAEVLRRGPDGFWYYRMKEKGKANAAMAYFRSADLAEEGERISVGEWRNSSRPENPEYIPQHLALILEKAADLGLEELGAIRTVSPDFEEERIFALSAATAYGSIAGVSQDDAKIPALLFGFCDSGEAFALVISQDGRGLYSIGNDTGVQRFALPPLPGGFAYTGIAFLGNVLVAAWEEQQEAGIGAAGFMALAAEWK